MKEEPGNVVEAGGNKQGWNKLPVGEKALDRESPGLHPQAHPEHRCRRQTLPAQPGCLCVGGGH